MKFFHLSDLHLGKRMSEFSMLDDQRHILMEIARIAEDEKPDAVLIAGDVYDKFIPGVEAVRLLDRFLVRLNELKITVFMIAGNHDSPERLAFASALLTKNNVHISHIYDGRVSPISLSDEHGQINVWMLPYLKPSAVRHFFQDKDIASYSDALAAALENAEIDVSLRNVFVAHQFVTGALTCESEETYVGGSENVDASLFDAFDYVALGHIHRPQSITRKTLRYCGSPLKYSFSESGQKSVTVLEMAAKGNVSVSEIPLTPIREMREIRGSYADITNLKNYVGTNINDYVHITLTDEEDEPDAVMKLRCVYPNMVKLDYDNTRTRTVSAILGAVCPDRRAPESLFGELYELQNGRQMDPRQFGYASEAFAEIWGNSV